MAFLSDENALREFERGIVDLITQSALQRAEHLLKQAIDQFGSLELRNAVDASPGGSGIEGWEDLCADMLEADQHFRNQGRNGIELVQLSLVNRQEGERPIGDLKVERKFFDSAGLNKYGTPEASGITSLDQPESPVRVTGLEDLMAIQRHKSPLGDIRGPARLQGLIDSSLSGLLLIVRYQQVVDRYLREKGLPLNASLVVQIDRVAWATEAGVYDFGPQARRMIAKAEHEPQPLDAAAEILAERTAERRSNSQAEVSRLIAEYREMYRILRMFPFYRFRARNKLADQFNSQLKLVCRARELSEQGVESRMSKHAFEEFLGRLAESMDPPSVDAALDPDHVDKLHERWVDLARAKDFKLGSPPLSMFELQLAWALKFGGPFVQARWEHAKPYRLER